MTQNSPDAVKQIAARSMTTKEPPADSLVDGPGTNAPIDFSNIRPIPFARVLGLLRRGAYVSGEVLAGEIETYASESVPPEVHAYLVKFLKGEIKKPRGAKPKPSYVKELVETFQTERYNSLLKWLRKRKKRDGGQLDGWSLLRNQDWWQGPPNERAARIVAAKYSHGAESWRAIQNIASTKSRGSKLHN